jgi:hypothetical protein
LSTGKERHEVGANKKVIINPCGKPKDTFEKLKSNAIGNPYVDAGQYDLRKGGPRGAGTGHVNTTMRSMSQPSGTKAFTYSGSQKLVKRSEFEHMHNGPPARPNPDSLKGFLSTVTPEPFTSMNKLGYHDEPFERAQDQARDAYAKQNGKILYRDQPFNHIVKQRGTFYPHFTTYGTNLAFPAKVPAVTQPPHYGAWKHGDPLHHAYNKTIGARNGCTEEKYLEEGEHDPIVFQKDVKRPIWKTTTNELSMANSTVLNNTRNINKETAANFAH